MFLWRSLSAAALLNAFNALAKRPEDAAEREPARARDPQVTRLAPGAASQAR